MASEIQGSKKYEQQDIKDASDRALREGKISVAQNHKDREVARWHGQRWHCPLPEYISHRVRADQALGNEVPAEVVAEYPPATGPWKIAPGCTTYFPGGVPKEEMADNRRSYGHRYQCAVSTKAKAHSAGTEQASKDD